MSTLEDQTVEGSPNRLCEASNENTRPNQTNSKAQPTTSSVAENRRQLAWMLQLHGYSACREALVLLEDHFTSSNKYESMEDFVSKLNLAVTFDTSNSSSIIDPELAYLTIQKLCNNKVTRAANADGQDDSGEDNIIQIEQTIPRDLTVKVKNVQYDADKTHSVKRNGANSRERKANEFNIHYNFLFKRLSSLPVFQGDFELTKLSTLTASSQPSIRCVCFGLLIKDISKIDGYLLIDSSGRVPLRISNDTSFRNRLAYTNCIVIVEGVYTNPDDVLFAANIGLPPILLDPIQDKSLACADEQLVVILRELYLDDEDVRKALDILFTGYNSMEDPPIMFILIGEFTREHCDTETFRSHMKKLIRIIRTCDNLKGCHYVFIPGPKDKFFDTNVATSNYNSYMPIPPLTSDQVPLNLLNISGIKNVHLATNPSHIYLGDRLISVIAQSYLKELRKGLLHDLSDHREELFDIAKQIMLSNGHLSAGISKAYHSSMNLWHRPDLLILADTEAIGNRYDYNSSRSDDTSFATVPSFSRSFNQFKVYYVNTGEIDDSQVTPDALESIEDETEVQLIDDGPSEMDD